MSNSIIHQLYHIYVKHVFISVNLVIRISCFTLLLLATNLIFAQNPPVPINPTASAINYSSKSNTNFFDGSETYSYPIGVISDGSVSHSVSVSNNTSGVRVGTLASDIGLGWHINAGGKISRSVRGISDGDAKTSEGWWKRAQQNKPLPDAQDIVNGLKDGAPDLYHVNAGNLNFSFFYDQNNDVHTIPKSNIKVQRILSSDYSDDASRFIVTDGLGTKYYFGIDLLEENIEFMETYAVGSDLIGKCGGDKMDLITGWFLYKIESSDGRDKIEFSYSTSGYEYYSLASQHKYKGSNGEDDHNFEGNDDYVDKVFNLFVVKTCRLNEISTNYEKFTFDYGNLRQDLGQEGIYYTKCGQVNGTFLRSWELDAINFSDNSGNICVSHEFELEYFDDNTTNAHGWIYEPWTKKRLCLNSITKKECGSNNNELKTTFSYYGGTFFPNCLSTALDHWGFCNSQWTNPKELIPSTTHGGYTYGSANRNPELVGSLHGILSKVTFPTNGYIQFIHELNEALVCDSGNCVNTPVGGLRLKKKTLSDGINSANNIVEHYEYWKLDGSYQSSGQLHFGLPEYATDFWLGTYFYFHPDFPLQNYFGSHINYCEVTKFQTGLGKTEITFENLFTTPVNSFVKPPVQYNNKIGFMTGQEVFGEGQGTSLSSTMLIRKNDPLSLVTSAKTAGRMHAKVGGFGNNSSATNIIPKTYNVVTGIQRVESKTSTNDNVDFTVTYGYDNQDKVYSATWQESTNSDGKVYRDEYSFSGNSIMTSGAAAINTLGQRNVKDLLWRTITKVDGLVVDGNYTEYQEYGSSAIKLVKPYREFRIERSWDDAGNIYPGQFKMWKEQIRHTVYTEDGRLSRSLVPGYSPLTKYEYYPDGKRLKSVSFNDQSTSYGYYGNSKVLNWKEGPDGLRTTYFFDGQGRLEKTLDECSGIFTEYSYVFGSSTNSPDDYVETTQNFTNNNVSHTNCSVTTLKKRSYVDGLGRDIQTVLIEQDPDGTSDIINAMSYDNYGRPDKTFLPYSSNGSGSYVAPSTSWGYAERSYEDSPLSRLENTNPPGVLPGRTFSFGSNSSNDNVHLIGSSSPYPVNTLYKIISTDAEGHKTIIFKDKIGRKVLSRNESSDGTKRVDTYYQYDLKGRLTNVYPAVPQELDGSIIPHISEKLLYKYTYYPDDKERTVKLPDSEYKEYRYNARGLLAASQDANQRANSTWLISQYDNDDRLFATWLFTGTVPDNETFNNLTTTSSDTQLSDIEYYETGHRINFIKREQRRVLDKDQWLIQDHTYDSCGRIQYTEFNNHLEFNPFNGNNTSSRTDFIYDQTNSIIETHLKQVADGSTYVLKQRDIKDHTGRIIGHETNWNNTGWKLQSETSYNERNEVIQTKLGETSGSWLQTVDYGYKEWGALHTINEGSPLGNLTNTAACNDLPSNGSNPDLFSLKLGYGSSNQDGVIRTVDYSVAGRKKEQQSLFYDYLNRLIVNSQTSFESGYTYDDRGNIKTLTRIGLQRGEDGCYSSTLIDDLTYNYTGACNQLQSVNDAVSPCPSTGIISTGGGQPGTYATNDALYALSEISPSGETNYTAGNMVKLDAGFTVDVSGSGGTFSASNEDCTTEDINLIVENSKTPSAGFIERGGTYLYDPNGNMTYDPNKLITYVYNHLNLVKEIIWDDGRQIDFLYDAQGNLLQRKVIPDLDPMPPAVLIDAKDYLGPIELFNGYLESAYHDSGRFFFDEFNTGNLEYRQEYSLADHVGNTRIVFSDLNGNGVIDLTQDPTTTEILQENHYYPFGMRMTGPWMEDVNASEVYQYNGIEYVSDYNLGLNMTTFRNLDPTLGRWTSVDPHAEGAYGHSPYNSMFNNPISMSDPDGDFAFVPILIGAAIGAYSGHQLAKANGATGWGMAGYMLGGAVVGGLSGGIGNAISTSGIAMANTHAIIGASFTNSLGMKILSGGQTDVTISFGIGSFNVDKGEFGYLGKKGNSALENIGYAMGAVANFNDAMAGIKSKDIGEVDLVTENSDMIGHSALVEKTSTTNSDNIVSFGPPDGDFSLNPLKSVRGSNAWTNHLEDKGSPYWRTTITGVNKSKILSYGAKLTSDTPKYNVYFSSCVTHTSRALTRAGFFNIGIHPFILHGQVALRDLGVRSHLFTTHLQNP